MFSSQTHSRRSSRRPAYRSSAQERASTCLPRHLMRYLWTPMSVKRPLRRRLDQVTRGPSRGTSREPSASSAALPRRIAGRRNRLADAGDGAFRRPGDGERRARLWRGRSSSTATCWPRGWRSLARSKKTASSTTLPSSCSRQRGSPPAMPEPLKELGAVFLQEGALRQGGAVPRHVPEGLAPGDARVWYALSNTS